MVKTIYVYLVLFATLMMTIGGSVAAFSALSDYVYPTPYIQTYESYKEMQMQYECTDKSVTCALEDDLMKKQYTEMIDSEKKNMKERALSNFIKSLGWIVIPFPVFLYIMRKK
ncbi:hypothetical protein IMZ31_22850 (plasmid) [Pontibacillus sp. ALD_SL1]|uniref:hypothetical protein n=1 Tax=Pontibacillus sp. ALD_SL1 TaxID=2777185 RepID=UPI001A9688E6|nr:hypothetical protein [Pontibacillus sp. ALD_SL1]QST02295.1 hypothetical protein IMZ31_22850 [Pontibacillus sp. ALD_SL1]